jgi:DNA-binding PadR family transcriptional regulator
VLPAAWPFPAIEQGESTLADYLFGKILSNKEGDSMKRVYLGEFEEIVLLTVAVLYGQAYGVTVTQEIERQTGRTVTFSTVHTTLHRLEGKGFLTSGMGGSTAERGGRRKRFYAVTAAGTQVLQEIQQVRSQLWSQVHPQAMAI